MRNMPMPSKSSINELISNLDQMFPNAKCELEYHNLFELIIAVVLSAQTTDVSVNKVTPVLFEKYPTYETLANAKLEDVENIIKNIGLYHNKAKNIIMLSKTLLEKGMPNTLEGLMELSGVGRKTANVVLGEYYSVPSIAVDTHVKRTSERLGLAKGTPYEIEQKLMKLFPKERWTKLHIQLVFLGRYVCLARKPKCEECLMKCKR